MYTKLHREVRFYHFQFYNFLISFKWNENQLIALLTNRTWENNIIQRGNNHEVFIHSLNKTIHLGSILHLPYSRLSIFCLLWFLSSIQGTCLYPALHESKDDELRWLPSSTGHTHTRHIPPFDSLQPTHFSFSHSTLATFPSIQQAELNRSLQHSCGDIPRQWTIANPYQACSFGEGRRVHEHRDSHSLGIAHNHSDSDRNGRVLPWIPHSMNCRAQRRLAVILLHHHIPLLLLPHDMTYLKHIQCILHDSMMSYSRKGFADGLTPSGVGWRNFAWLGFGIRSQIEILSLQSSGRVRM